MIFNNLNPKFECMIPLQITVKREKIIDFLQELVRDGFSILTNESKAMDAIDQSQAF